MFALQKVFEVFKPEKMQELHIRYVSAETFCVLRLEYESATIFQLEEYSPHFSLDSDGGLPQELFMFLSQTTKIPVEDLNLHIVEETRG